MADPESQESTEYSVGGLQQFKEARAQHFLVEVLGRCERISMKMDLNEGAKEIEMRMRTRYGAAYLQDCARLLKNQLESSDEDQEIWGSWRAEYAEQSVLRTSPPKLPTQLPQDRASQWLDSADAPTTQPTMRTKRKSVVMFPPESDFETRVNSFLGSIIPTDLSLEPQAPSCSSQLSPNKLAFGGAKMSAMGNIKQSLSGVMGKLKGKKP